jgi:hypothetical protein
MAGRPKERRLLAAMTRLAREEIGPDAQAADWVEAWIESGKSVNAMHAHLQRVLGEDFTRPWLSRVMHASLGPDASERIYAARKKASHQLVEEAQEIADGTEGSTSREEIASAKLRADIRIWRAKTYNRDELGERPPTVNVTLNRLHLDALRQLNAARAVSNPAVAVAMLPSGEPDTEVLEEIDVDAAD